MKADACLYATLEPLTSKAPLTGLCGHPIQRPEIVGGPWDDVPTGTRLEMANLKGICAKCLKCDIGGKYLYAVRQEEPSK